MERKVANFWDGRCGGGGGMWQRGDVAEGRMWQGRGDVPGEGGMWQGRGDVKGEGGCERGGGMWEGEGDVAGEGGC